MAELNAMEAAIYDLIQRYVERQQVAYDALRELRPDALAYHDKEATGEMLAAMVKAHMHKTNGEWGAWDYTITYKGLRMLNRSTQEPLEWDAPDVSSFSRDALLTWIDWYLGQPANVGLLLTIVGGLGEQQASLNELVFPTLNRFVKRGILYQKDTAAAYKHYTLGKRP